MAKPTVADELLIESLPEEVQAVIKRVYGSSITVEDLESAYEAGFEDAAEHADRPYYERHNFTSWRKYHRST